MTTLDPTLTALLAAIHASPDDDTPRLVLADRLDELDAGPEVVCPNCGGYGQTPKEKGKGGYTSQGVMYRCLACSGTGSVPDTSHRDRAEFVRVQCEWSSWERPNGMFEIPPTAPGKQRLKWCLERMEDLLAANRAAWELVPCPRCNERGEVAVRVDDIRALHWRRCDSCTGSGNLLHGLTVTWHRGFPATVVAPFATWVQVWDHYEPPQAIATPRARAVRTALPTVEAVLASDREPREYAGNLWWSRRTLNAEDYTWILPEQIYYCLDGYERMETESGELRDVNRYYSTADAARLALGRVLLELANEGDPR